MPEFVGALLTNAFDKVFGAALLALITAVVRGGWNTLGRFRLGVGGIYVTRTSGTAWLGHRDRDDDGPVRRLLIVKQFGWDLQAKESGHGENAEWRLQAHLTADGFIQGQYTQRRPLTGISRGAFYLEQDRAEPRRFRGLRTGWNINTRDIASGTYEWMQIRKTSWWRPALPWVWPTLTQADVGAAAAVTAEHENPENPDAR